MKMYTINDLVNGASKLATSVFGKREKYELQFNHEDDGCWYVDFPGWPFDHHNLMMVSGADRLCAILSDDDRVARVEVIPSSTKRDLPDYAQLTQLQSSLAGGSTYKVTNLHRHHLALSSNLVCAGRISEVSVCEENSKTYRRKSKNLKQKRYIETIIKEKKKSSQTFFTLLLQNGKRIVKFAPETNIGFV